MEVIGRRERSIPSGHVCRGWSVAGGRGYWGFLLHNEKLSSYGQNVRGLIIFIDLEEPQRQLSIEMMHTNYRWGATGESQMTTDESSCTASTHWQPRPVVFKGRRGSHQYQSVTVGCAAAARRHGLRAPVSHIVTLHFLHAARGGTVTRRGARP